jgi:dienelactone hydrolase
MGEIVLFHSVLGLRPAVEEAAERLREAGHVVHTPDLYNGLVFDAYEPAFALVEKIGGPPELVARAGAAVAGLPEALVYAGFSAGGVTAELLAATRPGALGPLLFHAAAAPERLGVPTWPGTVPVQVHFGTGDPYREQDQIDRLGAEVRASGASYELFDYDVPGHLFADPGLPDEFDAAAADEMSAHALEFLARFAPPR